MIVMTTSNSMRVNPVRPLDNRRDRFDFMSV